MPLNPNSAKQYVNEYSAKSLANQVHDYPEFFMGLKLNVFRHIRNLPLTFSHPISVISGSNRSGKTTALMAIACSHFNFMHHNVNNDRLERATWSSVVRFTSQDIQGQPWSYQVKYRTGLQIHTNSGTKNATSSKWSGVAKKAGQIGRPTAGHINGGRTVIFIDLNRINPSRHLSKSYFNKFRNLPGVVFPNQTKMNEYLSYILEDNYNVTQIGIAADSRVFKFSTLSNYSSYNTASGEDVLSSMIYQILEAPMGSLVLIDEIEIGLHPKIQRRLMDVLYFISKDERKQFIITSHAYAILDSVPAESRLFIDNGVLGVRCLTGLSTYESLTRMDCETFPVTSVYVEDEVSKLIVNKAIAELTANNPGFNRLLKVVIIGSANKTFNYFTVRKDTHSDEPNTSKPACVLDGDMKNKMEDGHLAYPAQDGLFFHYSDLAPESMLLKEYLANHPHAGLQYHLEHSNPHCLLQKMVEEGVAVNHSDAFDICFAEYRKSSLGADHFETLKQFLMNMTI
jgi:predicted ATPase